MYSYQYRYNVNHNRFEPRMVYTPPPPPQPHFYNPTPIYTNYNPYNPYRPPLDDLTKPKPTVSTGTSKDDSKDFKIPYHPVYTATNYDDGKFGKKMIIFTYALFVYHILLILATIIYSSITFDLDMLEYCIIFFFFFTVSEALYISYSLKIFIKKTLDESKCCYSFIVIISASLSFITAMVDFTYGDELPTGHYVIFIGGISILFLMSMTYFMLAIVKAMSDF